MVQSQGPRLQEAPRQALHQGALRKRLACELFFFSKYGSVISADARLEDQAVLPFPLIVSGTFMILAASHDRFGNTSKSLFHTFGKFGLFESKDVVACCRSPSPAPQSNSKAKAPRPESPELPPPPKRSTAAAEKGPAKGKEQRAEETNGDEARLDAKSKPKAKAAEHMDVDKEPASKVDSLTRFSHISQQICRHSWRHT